MEFQFTRPAWGATAVMPPEGRFERVSIHAPRVGRDGAWDKLCDGAVVSIHAPRVGRDDSGGRLVESRYVSIHAPRVGRDIYQ
mgnify:CR=1 FL=1